MSFIFSRVLHTAAWSITLLAAGALILLLLRAHNVYSSKKASTPADSVLLCSKSVKPVPRSREKVAAIIIDDLGRDMVVVERLLDMKIPVTLAVLPYRRYSGEVARQAFLRGREVLLHLPLQPRDYPAINPGAGCLLLSMDRFRIQSELDAQISSLPFCAGVNTHMGSLFTENGGPMGWVFSVLKERNLFFVDSLVTPASVAERHARSHGVRFAERTHFLDGKRDEAHIIKQLCRLADFAALHGRGVGIGHPYPETLEALPKALAAFSEKGVKLVPASEIVHASDPEKG